MAVPSTNNNNENQTIGNLSNSQQRIISSLQGGPQVQVVNIPDVPKQLMSTKNKKLLNTSKNLYPHRLLLLANALKQAQTICAVNVKKLDVQAVETNREVLILENGYRAKAMEGKMKKLEAINLTKEAERYYTQSVALAATHPEQSRQYQSASRACDARAQALADEAIICAKESQDYLSEANYCKEQSEIVSNLADSFVVQFGVATQWRGLVKGHFQDMECTSTPRPSSPESKAKKPIKISISSPPSHSVSPPNSEQQKQPGVV